LVTTIDAVVGKLGSPLGIKSYKPCNSLGEDFLPNYLGMVGLPIEMVPEYPAKAKVALLTVQAAADPTIVAKMKATLQADGDVFITSGWSQRWPNAWLRSQNSGRRATLLLIITAVTAMGRRRGRTSW
jgi:hypothetical protein